MRKNLIYCLMAFFMLMLTVSQANAWYYNDYPTAPTEDTKFEMFGPRCDRMLIKLYSTAEAEWEALKRSPQELDVTDWPLVKAYYDEFIVAPPTGYADRVNVVSVGGEFGIRCLDMNQNPNRYLGVPPDPAFPNPVRNLDNADPKDDNNPTSDVNFRKAVLSCIDRDHYVANIIGAGFAVPLWCALPPATGMQYYNPAYMQAYPFSPTSARSFLEAGKFKINTATGKRYWDLNGDGVEQDSEYVGIKFIIRSDDTHRLRAGDHIADALEAVGVRVERMYLTITGARTHWFASKAVHLYTAGWSLGIEPDSIVLWMGDAGVGKEYSYYWHPGTCYNTPYANDAEFNIAARKVEIANSEAEAVANMEICNRRMAEAALNGPMFCYSSTMANARKYVGGTADETPYVGSYWDGMVMVTGYGSDSYFGFLNMRPRGFERPEYGTIRYGFKTTDIRMFNSIYAEWVWDNTILDLTYDTLIASNPYSLTTRMNWICANYTVGTYTNPTLGECTKVRFTLRPDVTWTDGTPLTMKDVYFTLVELAPRLRAKGYANPWWYSAVKSILSFSILDPYTFEVLIDVKSIWAFGLTGAGVRILPEHIWRPIVETGDPTGVAPDPNMISSGPWRVREYVAVGYVDLVANKPGRAVKTSGAPFTGSTSITSPKGYFRYSPIIVDVKAHPDYLNKFDKGSRTLTVTLFNEWYGGSVTVDKTVEVTYKNGTKATLASVTGKIIASRTADVETFTIAWPYGNHSVTVTTRITAPAWATIERVFPYTCWVTIGEDFTGAKYLGNDVPDIKVDMKDIGAAAKAFGSYPGHPRWSTGADLNLDYKVDMKDIGAIAKKFGFTG